MVDRCNQRPPQHHKCNTVDCICWKLPGHEPPHKGGCGEAWTDHGRPVASTHSEPDITANFHKGARTSVLAHASTSDSTREAMRLRIVDFIASCGARGATCDEVEAHFGFAHQSCSARMTELKKEGRIKDAGVDRKTRMGRYADAFVV